MDGFSLANGQSAVVRRLRADAVSAALVQRLLAACRPADLRARFGSPRPVPDALNRLLPRRSQDLTLAAISCGQALGVVNVNRFDDTTWETAVLVAPGAHRRGVASALLEAARVILPTAHLVAGQIEQTNVAALRLLRSMAPSAQVRLRDGMVEFIVSPVDTGGGG